MKHLIRSTLILLTAFAMSAPVSADPPIPIPEYYTYNDGQGNCYTIACGNNGCVVIDIYPCPREMGRD